MLGWGGIEVLSRLVRKGLVEKQRPVEEEGSLVGVREGSLRQACAWSIPQARAAAAE